jgi:hypothetical protein
LTLSEPLLRAESERFRISLEFQGTLGNYRQTFASQTAKRAAAWTPREPERMDNEQPVLPQTYIPYIAMMSATLRGSLRRLEVAAMSAPEQICGTAQRVGYTGNQLQDLAIYRLKVKGSNGCSQVTLPGFYVIENGAFVEYEQWQGLRGRGARDGE